MLSLFGWLRACAAFDLDWTPVVAELRRGKGEKEGEKEQCERERIKRKIIDSTLLFFFGDTTGLLLNS